jgi:tight adherence protein B
VFEGLLSSRILAALAAFLAVALLVVAVALLWEGLRIGLRRRAVGRELRKLTSGSHGQDVTGISGLLKEQKGELPEWLSPVAARIPRLADINLLIEQARSDWSLGTFLLLSIGFALGAGSVALLFGLGFLVSLGVAAAAGCIPYIILVRRRGKRVSVFEEQFPEVIELLARSARAGHAFQAGLQEVAEEAPDPCGEEFRQVFEEQRFGLPLSESLLGLADRMDLVDVRMFVTSVMIQKETGGNLAENMDNLARLIRARFKFKRQIKVHSAHGRMTGVVLGIAPIAAGIGLYVLNPDYMGLLFTEELGRYLLAAGIFFQLLGFFVIRRMTEIEY